MKKSHTPRLVSSAHLYQIIKNNLKSHVLSAEILHVGIMSPGKLLIYIKNRIVPKTEIRERTAKIFFYKEICLFTVCKVIF